MRMSRRSGIYAKTGVTWDVYSITYTSVKNGTEGKQDPQGTTISTTYSIENGQYKLGTIVSGWALNRYCVNITDTAPTTGDVLYKSIDAYMGYVTFQKYILSKSKGTFINSVTAEAGTYPNDGYQGEYWYVLQS